MRVTAEMLRKAGPVCKAQLRRFEKAWPKGMLVTGANLRRAIKLGLAVEYGLTLLAPQRVWRPYRLATSRRYDAVAAKFVNNRWAGYSEATTQRLDTRAWRDYLRSAIPDILKAAREMDDVQLSSVEAKARRKK